MYIYFKNDKDSILFYGNDANRDRDISITKRTSAIQFTQNGPRSKGGLLRCFMDGKPSSYVELYLL